MLLVIPDDRGRQLELALLVSLNPGFPFECVSAPDDFPIFPRRRLSFDRVTVKEGSGPPTS